MGDYQFLQYETHDDGAIVRILLDRPEARNAQNRGLLVELDEAFLRAEADDACRVVILGGTGPLFSSGHDMGSKVAIEEYQKVAADAHGQRVAEVRVAHELSSADIERLQAALSNQYGRTVHLNVVVDPDILGGMRVEIGDDVIDGTVSGRIDDARRRLAG